MYNADWYKNNPTINYKGANVKVRGGEWLDIMNSCFYRVIDKIHFERRGYDICIENGEDVIFALPNGDNGEE